jgi:hypothetical protein
VGWRHVVKTVIQFWVGGNILRHHQCRDYIASNGRIIYECRIGKNFDKKQDILGRTNRRLSLIRHEPHRKRRIQQFFYCCVCIRYRGNVSTEALPSNGRITFTETSCCLATIGGYTYRHTDCWEGFFSLLSLFWKNRIGLWDYVAACVCPPYRC